MERLWYQGKLIEYEIIPKKIKNLYIQVKDGKVYVKIPYQMDRKKVQEFVHEKTNWIASKLIQEKKKFVRHQTEKIKLLGKVYPVQIQGVDGTRINVEKREHKICVCVPKGCETNEMLIQSVIKNYYMQEAKQVYAGMLKNLIAITNLQPNAWRVRDIQYAWGSCSTKRNITLSLNLIQERQQVIEYVILHELCHLKHMNHAKAFWDLVAEYMPDYKIRRKELKQGCC